MLGGVHSTLIIMSWLFCRKQCPEGWFFPSYSNDLLPNLFDQWMKAGHTIAARSSSMCEVIRSTSSKVFQYFAPFWLLIDV